MSHHPKYVIDEYGIVRNSWVLYSATNSIVTHESSNTSTSCNVASIDVDQRLLLRNRHTSFLYYFLVETNDDSSCAKCYSSEREESRVYIKPVFVVLKG